MKCIIYFGHHKVGSTALQSYLARNALPLLQHGILYPAVESQGLSHLLALAMGVQHEPALDCMNVREPHNALAFRMLANQKPKGKTPPWHGRLPGLPVMLNTIRHQVDVLQPEVLILCSEVFANFGSRHRELIAKLHNLFPNASYELYCVLRRPDEYLTSWFGQRLRFGHKIPPLNQHVDLTSIHFDYRKMVEPWRQAFPGSPLHLRNYSDVLAAGGAVQDFTAQFEPHFPKGLPEGGPRNIGLLRASLEIARRANHDLPPERAHVLRQYLLTLDEDIKPVPNRDVEMFGAEVRADLAARFAPIHDWLSDTAGVTAFFPDIGEVEKTRPVSQAEATADLLSKLDPETLPGEDLRDYVAALRDKTPV